MPPADANHHPALTTILFQLIFTCESLLVPPPSSFFPICFHLAIKGAKRHVLGPAAKSLLALPASRIIPTEAASSPGLAPCEPRLGGKPSAMGSHPGHSSRAEPIPSPATAASEATAGRPSAACDCDLALPLNLHQSQAALNWINPL